ncbi:uncharacterized protein BDR25DRAFT_363442 [Lindgomyces ingoldianus]|uniref:Uncharacterized protein n=1 Tax=Lindgomyces ingoldianus TaxID=673940 RepID=A0ACB6Q9R5_9PLEO|nr:uncharacterized protein BDR25DRAFT_363442 [Lindgomyces ingoldianus]KAF2462862.1 hypothetical protein BDR25DRAFT_363442 [Lindgomyces ingoldianus]
MKYVFIVNVPYIASDRPPQEFKLRYGRRKETISLGHGMSYERGNVLMDDKAEGPRGRNKREEPSLELIGQPSRLRMLFGDYLGDDWKGKEMSATYYDCLGISFSRSTLKTIENHTPTSKINNSTTMIDLKEIINSINSADSGASKEALFKLKPHSDGYKKQRLLKAQDTKTLIEHINRLTLQGLPPTKAIRTRADSPAWIAPFYN